MMQSFHHLVVRVGYGEVTVAKYANREYAMFQARELRRKGHAISARTHQARILQAGIPAAQVELHLRAR